MTWTAPGNEALMACLAMMPNDRVDGIQAFVSHVIPENENSANDASMQPKDPVQVLDVDKGNHAWTQE